MRHKILFYLEFSFPLSLGGAEFSLSTLCGSSIFFIQVLYISIRTAHPDIEIQFGNESKDSWSSIEDHHVEKYQANFDYLENQEDIKSSP